jgi:hypothetical protein
MGETEPVSRAQRAAARLESAWEGWRTRHGLGGVLAQPVASYVGYAPEDPQGRPRVVFGVDAAEAEQLAVLLDGLTRAAAVVAVEPGSPGEADPDPAADPGTGSLADFADVLPDASPAVTPVAAVAVPVPGAAAAVSPAAGVSAAAAVSPAAGATGTGDAAGAGRHPPGELPRSLAEPAGLPTENPKPAKGRQLLSRRKGGIRPTAKDGAGEPADRDGDRAPSVAGETETDPAARGDEPASPGGSGAPTARAVARPAAPAAHPAIGPRPTDIPSAPAPSIAAELAGWAAGELPGQASGLAALGTPEQKPRPGPGVPPRPREPADNEREGRAGSLH